MKSDQRHIARKLFRLRVHEAKRSEYQRLFEKVMQYRYMGFVPVRPYGNFGDRKNDGYIPETGTYYQVYAPERPDTNRTAVIAAQKAAEDFAGLLEYWETKTPVRCFRFVFNDEYHGSPPPLEAAIAQIRAHVPSNVFLAKDLENEAFQLNDDELLDVIGTCIPELGILESVGFDVLSEVVAHVMAYRRRITLKAVLNAPDFDEKIKFNGLSPGVATLLKNGSFQADAVTDYFSMNSKYARQELRDQLASIYDDVFSELQEAVPPSDLADLAFFSVLSRVAPHELGAQAQEAGIIIMAFFFEACDIFEDPSAST